MNVGSAKVALRDRPMVDVLDLALRFVVVHGRAYALLAAAVVLPALLASLLVAEAWGWVAGWSVAVPLALLTRGPFILLASRLVFEEEVRTRDVLRDSLRALPRLVGLGLAWLVVMTLAAALLLVPAVWAASALFFLDEVALLERSSVLQTLARAQRLATSSIGESLLGVFAFALLAVGATLLADVSGRAIVGDLLQFRPPQSVFREGGSALAVLGWLGAVPLLATARFFTYLNVRTRAEGWDIQTRFAAIAARAEGE
jgi:hypothetical protein